MIALFVNYKSLSDGQLMERVRRKDDEKAFAELYRRYARLLQGFFFRRLGGDEEKALETVSPSAHGFSQSLTTFARTPIGKTGTSKPTWIRFLRKNRQRKTIRLCNWMPPHLTARCSRNCPC